MCISKSKKILALFTGLILLAFTACNNSAGSSDNGNNTNDTPFAGEGSSGNGSGSGGSNGSSEATTLANITNPITLTVPVKAHTDYCDLYRIKTDADGNEIANEPWICVGCFHPSDVQNDDNSVDRTKKFTDIFGVTNGCYYKYKTCNALINDTNPNDNWNDVPGGPYQATYDGLRAPSFGSGEHYPVIEFVEATSGQSAKMHLANADSVGFTFYNQEELISWALSPVYNWNLHTWLEQTNPDYNFNNGNGVNLNNVGTGDNQLTDFYVTLEFNHDTNCDFPRRFFYNINDIDNSKIAKKIVLKKLEINETQKTVNMKVKLPENTQVKDVYIQRRVHEENTVWERNAGYLDNVSTNYTVGCVTEKSLSTHSENGFVTFTDRYGFLDQSTRYDYRAIIRVGNNYEEIEVPLGTTASVNLSGGVPVPINLSFYTASWNPSSRTLTLSTTHNFSDISGGNTHDVMIRYVKSGDTSKQFSAIYQLRSSSASSATAPDIFDSTYTLNAASCSVITYLSGQGNQMGYFYKGTITHITSSQTDVPQTLTSN